MTDTTSKEETPRCERCGLEMQEFGFFWVCPDENHPAKDAFEVPYQTAIAALRSENEALRKRNEELGQDRDSWRRVAEKCESRAQEAETKLRAAEDAVVALRERIEFLMPDMEAINDQEMSVAALKEALSNTSALAAQRKREIAEAAAKAEREHIRAVLIDGWMTADSFDAAILNPEGPDANTEGA